MQESSARVALVTGATSGIGVSIAKRLVDDGFRVLITGRSEERGRRVLEELGERAHFIPADLTDVGSIEKLVVATEAKFGRVDVLVNNAAIDHTNDLLSVTKAEMTSVFQTNTFGVINCTIAVAQRMERQGSGGSIINITSRLASIGVPQLAIYSASKGAIHAFTKAAAIELAPQNIRVNSVAPGLTRTPLFEEWLRKQDDPESEIAIANGSIPLGRIAEPADVAGAVSYLASPDSTYLTGISIPVDGGYLAQ